MKGGPPSVETCPIRKRKEKNVQYQKKKKRKKMLILLYTAIAARKSTNLDDDKTRTRRTIKHEATSRPRAALFTHHHSRVNGYYVSLRSYGGLNAHRRRRASIVSNEGSISSSTARRPKFFGVRPAWRPSTRAQTVCCSMSNYDIISSLRN